MWLYWCLLATIISGFIPIALKKCSDNQPKHIVIVGLLLYHFIMVLVSLVANPEFIIKLNIIDMLKMLPGIIIQSIGFYCAVSATKYGKVTITSSIQKTKVFVTFILGKDILKEWSKILQLVISTVLVILSILVAKSKNDNKEKIDKKLEKKAIMYSYGFVIFNGTSDFINKIYVIFNNNLIYSDCFLLQNYFACLEVNLS